MKKHLLFLSLALAAMSASADSVVFDFTGDEAYGMTLLSGSTSEYNADPYVCTDGDVTLTLNGKTRWWAAASGNELRMYKESSLAVAVPTGYHVSEVTLDAKLPGSFNGSGYVAPTWTGSLAEVVINCAVASGNTPIYKIIVTYAEGDPTGEVTPTDPVAEWGRYDAPEDAGPGKYLIYANGRVAIPNTGNYGYLQTTPVEVDGLSIITKNAYAFELVAVDGGYNIKDSNGRYLYQNAEYDSFNYANTVTAGDDSFVWLVEDDEDNAFHIYNSATDKSIYFSTEHNTFGAFADFGEGYARPTLYAFVEDTEAPDTPVTPDPETNVVTVLSDIYSLANNDLILVNLDLTVVYANGAYVYVCDGANYGLIYKADLGLTAGDVITAGWNGKVSIYNNLYELVPTSALTTNGTADIPVPVEITADNADQMLIAGNQNVYAVLEDVTFGSATPAPDAAGDDRSYTGTMGDLLVNFYQRFGIDSVEPGTYDVIGFISVYKEMVQFQPIAIVETGGIAGIAADSAPAVYYDLQGVPVANPSAGRAYIRVIGSHATKVVK